jgi:hypothetical protein
LTNEIKNNEKSEKISKKTISQSKIKDRNTKKFIIKLDQQYRKTAEQDYIYFKDELIEK